MTARTDSQERLSTLERILLLIPAAGGTFFGLLPFLLGGGFGKLFGAPGNDDFIYRLSGAAAFGYPIALALGARDGDWLPLRFVVIATAIFNIGSLYACLSEILGGTAIPVVYVILVASIAILAITGSLLYRYREARTPTPDTAQWLVWFLGVATLLAFGTGLLSLFIPEQTAHFFGYKGTDAFLFRQGGAATLGYAVMGIFELRSRVWSELRLPLLMAAVFNGLSLIASLIHLIAGEVNFLVLLIGVVGLGVTIGALVALQRRGR